MRLLLVGAFAFPHDQGSQVYFQEQALALHAAGADVHLLTYGPGRTADPNSGLGQTTLPGWALPRTRRSGPNLGKPLADLVLTAALRRLVGSRDGHRGRAAAREETASSSASGSASKGGSKLDREDVLAASQAASSKAAGERRAGFDAILAHHAEAALSALHGLRRSRPPILYCAHTLLEQELPLYFGAPSFVQRIDPSGLQRGLARLGGALDRWIARRADGWIALTQASERVMRASSRAPGRQIGPPVSDPGAIAERRDDARRLAAHGLSPGGFFLYCGNLDPYQDLPLLEQVALRRSADGALGGTVARGPGPARSRLPLVVATHGLAATDGQRDWSSTLHPGAQALARRLEQAGVRVVPLGSAAEARALFAGARATIVPRRSLGGFPIKLVNSLAAGTPIVAYHGEEWGLVDGHEGLIADPAEPVASLAEALSRLESDPALAERLGRGARARYTAEHRPAITAAATLELIRAVVERCGR